MTDKRLLRHYSNILQLDSADEQAAAIRRELDGRMQKVNEMERVRYHNIIIVIKKTIGEDNKGIDR